MAANGFGACARLLMETQHLSSNPQMAQLPRVSGVRQVVRRPVVIFIKHF